MILSLFTLLLPAALAAPGLEPRADHIWLTYYETDNCKGIGTVEGIHPGHENFGHNFVTKTHVPRSFYLSRPMTGKMQLDISSTKNLEDKDYSDEDSFCSIFKHSYFADDDLTECVKTGPFTCFKAWENKGLKAKDD
ncbi:hypothetical protein BDV06DRAFT_225982 [Aspergillus oleicola]